MVDSSHFQLSAPMVSRQWIVYGLLGPGCLACFMAWDQPEGAPAPPRPAPLCTLEKSPGSVLSETTVPSAFSHSLWHHGWVGTCKCLPSLYSTASRLWGGIAARREFTRPRRVGSWGEGLQEMARKCWPTCWWGILGWRSGSPMSVQGSYITRNGAHVSRHIWIENRPTCHLWTHTPLASYT